MRWYAQMITIAVLLCSVVAAVGADEETGRIRENLYDVKFVSVGEGWAVGQFGTVVHTVDGGKHWERQPTRTDEPLYGVDMKGDDSGWAVGRAGIILHTSDGKRWAAQQSKTQNHLFKVRALSRTTAWAIGDWGTILQTDDGGTTWSDRSLTEDVVLSDICFADPQHGWIVGEAGTVLVTADGGSTWSRQRSGTEKTLFGVHFVDQQRGWAVGIEGLILHTTDGGATWATQRGNAATGSLEQMGFLEALRYPSLYAVDVTGDFAVAVGDLGMVLLSSDGGQTWKEQDVPAAWRLKWFRGTSVVPGTHGAVVGATGLLVPLANGALERPGS